MKRWNKIALTMVVALAAAAGVQGQGEGMDIEAIHSPESLKRCLEAGLVANYDLQIVRVKEQQATNSAHILNSGYLPTLDLDGSYELDNSNDKYAPRSSQSYRSKQSDLTTDLGVSLDWTIFDGLDVRTSYERLQELESQSKVETRIAIEDYIASLTAEYYNYIKQQNTLRILNMAVDLSKERLRIVRARYTVGSYSRLDLQQARVDFNVDSADYIKQRELVKSSQIALNELMAAKNVNAAVNIPDTVINLDAVLTYKDLLYRAEANNSELLYAEHDTNIAKMDLKRVLSRNYPYLGLYTDYGYTHNNLGAGNNRYTGKLGLQVGVSMSFTLFDTQRHSQRQNARLDVTAAELQWKSAELQLHSQLSDLWQAYVNNMGLLHLERNSLGAAKENYEIAMERYMIGDLSGIEMREAQISLLDAQDRIIQATYNTKLCEISLMQISGQVTRYLE